MELTLCWYGSRLLKGTSEHRNWEYFYCFLKLFHTVCRCPGRCVLRQAHSKGPKITKTRAKPQIWVELNWQSLQMTDRTESLTQMKSHKIVELPLLNCYHCYFLVFMSDWITQYPKLTKRKRVSSFKWKLTWSLTDSILLKQTTAKNQLNMLISVRGLYTLKHGP